jgi:hypothetical protein
MQCPKCGWNNPDEATKCANCSADLQQPAQPVQPPQPQPYQQPQQPYQQQPAYQQPYGAAAGPAANYMVWSVINVVLAVPFCNLFTLVLGIIGIVKSSSTNSKNAAGDYMGARGDATTALVLNIIASALLVLLAFFSIMFWVGFFKGINQGMHYGNFPQ